MYNFLKTEKKSQKKKNNNKKKNPKSCEILNEKLQKIQKNHLEIKNLSDLPLDKRCV